MNEHNCDALREAMARYSTTVYRLAYARTRNRADAEDIYQEVFLRFAAKCGDFESPEHQKAWLIRATANLSVNLLRSAWRRHAVTSDMALEPEHPAAEGVSDRMNRALEALPARYRTVIHLFYFEEMHVDEIASALGMKPATVRAQLTRGRDRLRKLLGAPEREGGF